MGEFDELQQELQRRIAELRAGLEAGVETRRQELRYRLERGRAIFEEEVRRRHLTLKIGLPSYLRRARPLVVLTAPLIYALILPLGLLDLFVSVYQAVCFPVYGIEKVRRRDHIVIDRHYLAYLNGLEKLNCIYCGYANGLIGFVREVAGRTEAYWCPIKHARRATAPHDDYDRFVDYGDAEGFRALWQRHDADGGR